LREKGEDWRKKKRKGELENEEGKERIGERKREREGLKKEKIKE